MEIYNFNYIMSKEQKVKRSMNKINQKENSGIMQIYLKKLKEER